MTEREEKMLAVLKAVRSELPKDFGERVSRYGEVLVTVSAETIDGVLDTIDQIEADERKVPEECEACRIEDKYRALKQAERDLAGADDSVVIACIVRLESGEYELMTSLTGNILLIDAAMNTVAQKAKEKAAELMQAMAHAQGISVPELSVEVEP